MLWTKLGMGLLGMAGKGLAGSGLLQTISQGLVSGKGGGKGMGCGKSGALHGGMKGSGSGKGGGKGRRQTDAPSLDELLTGLLQRQTTVGETVRAFLPAASPHDAGAEAIDVQALPAGTAPSTAAAVDSADMEAAMRALLDSIHHFSDGRVRLRHPLFRESGTFGALHRLLCEGTGIRDATFNAVTGSALLTYDPAQMGREEFLHQALPLGACLLEWEARHA